METVAISFCWFLVGVYVGIHIATRKDSAI